MSAPPRKARQPVPDTPPEDDEFEASTTTAKPVARAPREDPVARHSTTNVSAPGVKAARPSVALDTRKLTKKQQGQLASWHGAQRIQHLDNYIAGIRDVAATKFGHGSVMAGNAMNNLLIGIPCPALAFEWVIAQDVFPLGLIIHLCGQMNSNKSAILNEFYRWFIVAGGLGNLFEVESKISPDLLPSITGFDAARLVQVSFCNSVEDWQDQLTFWLREHKKRLIGTKEEPGPGRTLPILFGVDTIMGKASWETQEKVRDLGHGGRNFPLEALSITQYMKTVPQDLTGWPFTLVLANHLKLSKDERGRDTRRTGGGSGVGFQESFELEMSVVKRQIECANWWGRVLRIRCYKNSYGNGERDCITRLLWWTEVDEAASEREHRKIMRQRSVWDWHWATVKLLTELEGPEAALLKDVFHIKAEKTSDVENTAWSSTLGMKAKDAVPWSELGALIANNEPVMDALRSALQIKRRPLLQGDFSKQLEGLAKATI